MTEAEDDPIAQAEQSLVMAAKNLLELSASEEGRTRIDAPTIANVRWTLEFVWDRAMKAQKLESRSAA